jgi:hypothetical protein
MGARSIVLAAGLACAGLMGCATRANDVAPAATNATEFAAWGCDRIDDELDAVQQRAADVAYAVDELAGNNILALGLGVTVFWPAMLAMRPDGLEGSELARLKGRDEALRMAARDKACPPPAAELPAARAASLPLSPGERLVYEDRAAARGPAASWVLMLTALRRGEIDFELQANAGGRTGGLWRQDWSGNVLAAPAGSLQWPHLLRGALVLGAVTSGDIVVAGDPLTRARVRGQVVAVGPQTVAGRRFDVAVLELFGDAQRGDETTRLDGAIAVDRASGVLLRLDLRSAQAALSLQRRLVRVEPAAH